jgi:MoxR-like ATPase
MNTELQPETFPVDTGTMMERKPWRERAMDDALRAEAEDGNGGDALLGALTRARPGVASLSLWVDRLRLLAFLRAQGELEPLLPGAHGHIERGEVCPALAWYAVRWEGVEVEVVMIPSSSLFGRTIVLADDMSLLQRLHGAMRDFAIRPAGRCLRYAGKWQSAPEVDEEIGKVTWDDIVLDPVTLASVREAVDGFADRQATLRAFGFPWRRGILLIGPPGTGKTMICKAAAAALPDFPLLLVRDFQDDEDDDYEETGDAIQGIFRRARKLAPCILSFEDLDGLVTAENRSVFLNELDGFAENDGLLVIASSNHPEKLDEALLKRPSRFDRVIHIGPPRPDERREFCRRWLEKWRVDGLVAESLDIAKTAQLAADRSEGFTPAYLKEALYAAALYEAQHGAETLTDRFTETLATQIAELRDTMRRLRDPEALASLAGSGLSAVGFRRGPR